MTTPGSVLIIDDDPAAAMALELAFSDAGWSAARVSSAEEALRILAERPYDVLMIDKNLPGINGVDLVREVRRAGLDPVMIMATGYASRDSALETLRLGVDSYIEKPFDDIFAVVDRVRQRLARRRGGATLSAAVQHFKNATAQLQAAQAPGDRIAVLVAAPDHLERNRLLQVVEPLCAHVLRATTLDDVEGLIIGSTLGLALIDARFGWELSLGLIGRLKVRVPEPGIIVLGDEDPPLRVVTRLIDFGVHSVLRRPLDLADLRQRAEKELGRFSVPRVGNGRGAEERP